jgi:hypothetical protein
MKTIRFAAFLFYRYYAKGSTSSIPYFSTIGAMAMLLYMHLFQILILTKRVDTLIPIKPTDNKPTKYLIMFFVLAPLYILLTLLIKKKDLQALHYSDQKIRTGNIVLIAYIILTMTLLFGLMFLIPKN